MVQGAVDGPQEGPARLPPLGIREARRSAVQPPVHLGIVGGHRADIGGGDHRTSTHLVQAAALLATVIMKIYGSAEDRLYRENAMRRRPRKRCGSRSMAGGRYCIWPRCRTRSPHPARSLSTSTLPASMRRITKCGSAAA